MKKLNILTLSLVLFSFYHTNQENALASSDNSEIVQNSENKNCGSIRLEAIGIKKSDLIDSPNVLKEIKDKYTNFDNPFIIKIYVSAEKDELDKIQSVTYELPKDSFKTPIVTIKKEGSINEGKKRFVYILNTWGTFPITTKIKLSDGNCNIIDYDLKNISLYSKPEEFIEGKVQEDTKIIDTETIDTKKILEIARNIVKENFSISILDYDNKESFKNLLDYNNLKQYVDDYKNQLNIYYDSNTYEFLNQIESTKTQKDIIKEITDNIEKSVYDEIPSKSEVINKIIIEKQPVNDLSMSKSKSNSESNKSDIFANGTASFLIERSKVEITNSFIQKFKDNFTNNPSVKKFFPNTSKFISLQNNISSYEIFLGTLRTAFYSDLQYLPTNLSIKISDSNKDKERLIKFSNIISLFLQNFDKLDNKSVMPILDYAFLLNNYQDEDTKNQVLAIREILIHLSSNSTDGFNFSKDLETIISNDKLLDNYISLIKDVTDIKFENNQKVKDNISGIINNQVKFKEVLLKAISLSKISSSLSDKINNKEKLLENKKQILLLNKQYLYEYFDLISTLDINNETTQIINLLKDSNDFLSNLYMEDYESSILSLLNIITNKNLFYDSDILRRNEQTEFFKYISFLSEVLKSNDSDQVQKALEKMALPVGSSIIRKTHKNSLDIGAYLGTKANIHSWGTKPSFIDISAPIGINWSLGFKTKESLSIFTSLFDLGTIVEYQLSNEGKYESNINLKNLINPGISVLYGFGNNLPFSTGFGIRWAPYQNSGMNGENCSNFNINAFLGVDIPIISLYKDDEIFDDKDKNNIELDFSYKKLKKEDLYETEIFLKGKPEYLDEISSVEYELHPTFKNRFKKVTDRSTDFSINLENWGFFTIYAEITFKNGEKKKVELDMYKKVNKK